MGEIGLQWDLNTHLCALLNRDVLTHLFKGMYVLSHNHLWVGFESTQEIC